MFNFYQIIEKKKGFTNPNIDTHGFQIPMRAIISSGSGTGKTNFLVNMIHVMNNTFHKIILCVKSSEEPLYKMLEEKLKGSVEIYENGEIAPLLQDTEDTDKNIVKGGFRMSKLIVFDDLMLENKQTQEKIAQFYIRGRKYGYSCIYISQNFYSVPITIRRNSNYFVLGRGLMIRDLKTILSSVVGSGDKDSLNRFTEAYKSFTKNPMTVCIVEVEKGLARKKINIKELEEDDVFYFH